MTKSIHDKLAKAVMTIPAPVLAEAERIGVEPIGDCVRVTFEPPIVVLRSEGWDD